eukprot:TRINITY_DN31660_c0_g1_i4.p1 TRINITY_DN31660_c0_g1~~TRINITY_DN31660_c0_g1_i4.p1  ORF type:complete len:248 (-),score=77.66 TRINITY_DN31660_c0_g1_i4:931-1674(-)
MDLHADSALPSPYLSPTPMGIESPVRQVRQTHVTALRVQLATLRQKELEESTSQRQECEALLTKAVDLRAKKRDLQSEVNAVRAAGGVDENSKEVRLLPRYREELDYEKFELDAARARLRDVQANAEDVDDDVVTTILKQTRERNETLCEETVEYKQAQHAAEQLSARLSGQLEGFEQEVRVAEDKNKAAGRRVYQNISKDELDRLRADVEVLRRRCAVMEEEVGYEAENGTVREAPSGEDVAAGQV